MMSLLELTKKLLACPSVTPDDAGCLEIIKEYLAAHQFDCETLQFNDVTNLYARRGTAAPLLVFAGHTDVVPPGPLDAWVSPPFTPTVRDGMLYARGACDMKGALAAMLHATDTFLTQHAHFNGSIAFLLTSDEEGPSVDGTKRVVDALIARGEKIDYCIIGEPSSNEKVGDQIRVGRRGSLHGKLTVYGKQGHVAHPHLADNALHAALSPLQQLAATTWDNGNQDFPPTSFQITNIQSGTGALNVIPGQLEAHFNFRFGTASTVAGLQQQVATMLDRHTKEYSLDWSIGAEPFLTTDGVLRKIVTDSIQDVMGYAANSSTGGGTSDGRFIIKTGAEIVELGLLNKTAHHINECVPVADLLALSKIYVRILEKCFAKK